MRSLFYRLLVVVLWAGWGVGLVGAVVIEGRRIQRHDMDVSVQGAQAVEVASVSEHARAGRSREQARPLASHEVLQTYRLDKNVSYGAASRLKLDFYVPDEPRADGKTVVFLYGGFWRSGTKSDYGFLGQALASRGITVVIPDYRVFPEVRFPTFVEDGAQAVRWAADQVGADKLFVMGHSAGAQIALMLAANTPYLANAGVDRMKLRGAIGLSGPYDFLPLNSSQLQDIFGGPDNPAVEPISFAKAPLPPALLIHGMSDKTVDPDNSEHLAAAWRKAGAEAVLKLYPGVNHFDVVASIADTSRTETNSRDDVMAFIDAH